ncbi:MAG TPA: hemerythrin domain-containing protein [Jatrophihabitantaceae bacterium]
MAEMSMNRVVHEAFRRDLARFENALDTLADGDTRRAQQLSAAWANFEHQLTIHHKSEHAIAWPALHKVGISDELTTKWDGEHEKMAAAMTTADAAMRALRTTVSSQNIAAARSAITELRTVALEHLEHEEADIEPFLLSHKGNPVLRTMGRQMGREYKLAESGVFFAWLQDGAGPEEKAALRKEIPGPVVAMLTRVFGGKYRRTIAPAWR